MSRERGVRERRDDVAEHVLRTLVDQGGLRIVGVPEALPSAQEPGAVVLRLDIRVPSAVIDLALIDRALKDEA